ncbi:MAG: flavodoxin family protein [Proteobacteria bacterium]|nr:flavodoxin family protein [Pseudomonadota bacterium]
MDLNIVGISGSPVRNGNTDSFLDYMLTYSKNYDAKAQAVYLSELEISDCVHCNFCISKQKKNKYCTHDDDAQLVFEMVEKADILILASPVHFMRTSSLLASFIDRLRVFVFGNVAGGRLKNKLGVSAAVAWARHGGLETTHLSHIYAFMTLEMIPVSARKCISPMGASAMSGAAGQRTAKPDQKSGIKLDKAGLHSAQVIVDRAVELANLMKPKLG